MNRNATLQAIILLITVAHCSLFGQENQFKCQFTKAAQLSASNLTINFAIGDIDGDSDIDLITRGLQQGQLSIFSNNGNAVFDERTFDAQTSPDCLDMFDMDNDGDVDLVSIQSFVLDVFQNDGKGNFKLTQQDYLDAQALDISGCQHADFDSDGFQDLAVLGFDFGYFDEWLGVFRNNSMGALNANKGNLFPQVGFPISMPIADIDGDFDLDIVVSGGDSAGFLINNGNAQFDFVEGPFNAFISDVAVALDMDNDLDVDLIFAHDGGALVQSWRNDGIGNFSFASSFVTFNNSVANQIISKDVNMDGNPDLVFVSKSGNSVALFLNNGVGDFEFNTSIDIDDPEWIQMEDMDGDDDLDLIVKSGLPAETLSIWLTDCTLLGDINLDGAVDLLDVIPFVTLLTTSTFQAEGDINCDDFVDLLDVQPFVDFVTGG